jgi:hypothetical protein
MTLRDQHGEVDVPFITDFAYKDALLTVICPAAEQIGGHEAIWCRLQKGFLELSGQRYEISENGQRPVLPFAADLVAHQVRLSRGKLPESANLQRPIPEGTAGRRARTSQKRENQPQPTTESLFD